MADQRLRELVLRIDQVILRVHLVLGFGPAEFCQEVLLFNAALGELYADFVYLVVALGLIQRAPTIANLQFDLVFLLLQVALGPFFVDQGGSIVVAFPFSVQAWIEVESSAPVITIDVRYGETRAVFLSAVDADQRVQIKLR